MRRCLLAAVVFLLVTCQTSPAQQEKKDPNQLFYTGNHYYEQQDYKKAVEDYVAILEKGIESGNLYYNIGNGFFKMGKIGYAILCYERARRLIPQDANLKSNLAYARSLAGAPYTRTSTIHAVSSAINTPFKDLNLSRLAILTMVFYLLTVLILTVFTLNPFAARKAFIAFFVAAVLFVFTFCAFCLRYYDEKILKHAIILQKDVECKYEPIENSTTYYKVHEGDEVLAVKARNGWSQIKRLDGKVAWVKKEALEII